MPLKIDTLTGEAARNIIHYLVENHGITEEDIKFAIRSNLTVDMKRLTDSVHSVFCKLRHRTAGIGDKADRADCCYQIEEVVDTCWTEPDHEYWLNITTELMEGIGFSSEASFLNLLGEARRITSLMLDMKNKNPSAYALLLKLLGLEQSPV